MAGAEFKPGTCARCALESGTCCTLEPGNEEYCFPVSPLERAAMEAAGAQAQNFHAEANSDVFVENLRRLFPGEGARIEKLFPAGGTHDRLAVDSGGACLLLGPEGCALPRAARPLYCRLFPFWVSGGRQLFFQFTGCLAQRERSDGAGLMARLGMTGAEVRQLYSDLRRAWGLPERS